MLVHEISACLVFQVSGICTKANTVARIRKVERTNRKIIFDTSPCGTVWVAMTTIRFLTFELKTQDL